MDAEVVVTSSTEQAVAFMQQHRPDLILVSALTPPEDDWSLNEFLKQTPEARQVPALTVPPLVDPDDKALQDGRPGLLSFFGHGRKPSRWQSYDTQALRTRLREALEESCSAARTSTRDARRDVAAVAPASYDLDLEQQLQDFARVYGERPGPDDRAPLRGHRSAPARTRARRWDGRDLPWLTEVTLPWGLRVELLNISSSGVLVESAARFVEGSSTVFQLSGPARRLLIPARVVRSEVAIGDSPGVSYQAAAIFDEAMEANEVLHPTEATDGRSTGASRGAEVVEDTEQVSILVRRREFVQPPRLRLRR